MVDERTESCCTPSLLPALCLEQVSWIMRQAEDESQFLGCGSREVVGSFVIPRSHHTSSQAVYLQSSLSERKPSVSPTAISGQTQFLPTNGSHSSFSESTISAPLDSKTRNRKQEQQLLKHVNSCLWDFIRLFQSKTLFCPRQSIVTSFSYSLLLHQSI